MTRSPENSPPRPPPIRPWLAVRLAWTILICSSSAVWLLGCATRSRVVVIPADRLISYLPAGQSATHTGPLYLVPPARMQEITRALAQPPPAP